MNFSGISGFDDCRVGAGGRLHRSANFLLNEYEVGDFYRVFALSETIDADKINAELKQSVLTVHLPKTAAVKPRKITVRGN